MLHISENGEIKSGRNGRKGENTPKRCGNILFHRYYSFVPFVNKIYIHKSFVLSLTVTNLNVGSVSSASLVLSWEMPTTPCSAEAEYAVEYRLTNKDQCKPSENSGFMRKSVSATSVTLSDLHPYSSYEIRVGAAGSVATTTAVTSETGELYNRKKWFIDKIIFGSHFSNKCMLRSHFCEKFEHAA